MSKLYFKGSFQILFFIIFSFLFISEAKSEDKPAVGKGTDSLSSAELTRGERLFYGLVYRGDRSVNCASCHNTKVIDSLNWNPNAYEISVDYLNKTPKDLSAVLLNPRGQKMAEVHEGIDLSEEDIVMIKGYMDEFAEMGLKKEKPEITDLLLFLLAVGFLLFSLADLMYFKFLRIKWVHLFIILASSAFITKVLVEEAIGVGRQHNYSPLQPIKFSHVVHAGQNQTDCNYCHSSVEYSKTAGIPGTDVCMNCHLVVRNGSRSGMYEIAKVVNAHEENIPIEWIRVHNLPDHVYFNHAQHVGAGKIECIDCHGKVEEMEQIIQVSDLSMGWCVNCHRESEVLFHSNEFYSKYEELRNDADPDDNEGITVDEIGGTDCMKCHY